MEKINFDATNYKDVRNLLHDKFGNINFIEESHQYFIGDIEYTPVSHIIKKYEYHVDWDKKAENYARKHNQLKEDVQRSWKLNNLRSTISGTRLHEFGESYTNLKAGYPELICEQNKRQYIEEFNTLVPTYPKEQQVVMFYEDGLKDYMHPVGAEFRLSTEYIDGAIPICGTCDLLFYRDDWKNPEKSGFVLGDWKTNSSLINDYNRSFQVYMKSPFDKWIDEAYNHYTLQLNLYQKMMESIGIKIVDRMLIHIKDDSYQVYKIDKIDDKILNQVIKQ